MRAWDMETLDSPVTIATVLFDDDVSPNMAHAILTEDNDGFDRFVILPHCSENCDDCAFENSCDEEKK